MFIDYYPDLNEFAPAAQFLITRINDIEEFLNKDAARDGGRVDIFPEAEDRSQGDTIHIIYSDAHGREESFTARILSLAPTTTGQCLNAMLVLPDLGAFPIACEYEGHAYDAKTNVMGQRLSAEICELRDTLREEIALRQTEKAPRQAFDIELKATPVDEWTLRVSPADRLWAPKPARPGLGERIRKSARTAWSRRPRFA